MDNKLNIPSNNQNSSNSNLSNNQSGIINNSVNSSNNVAGNVDGGNQNIVVSMNQGGANNNTNAVSSVSSSKELPKASVAVINTSLANDTKIEETTVTKASHGSLVVAVVDNGTTNILTDKFPEKIDISLKAKTVVNKNGKKIKIMTKRELITNIVLSVIFVVILGVGGYYGYMYLFNVNPRNFKTKDVVVEYGNDIPLSVRNYINLTDISEMDYTLDISQVKTDVGTYTYKVTYEEVTKTGTLTVKDTTPPVITFKEDINIPAHTEVTKDMLVSECSDLSDCSYDLTEPVDTSMYGQVNASITATDQYGNSKTYETTINVIEKTINMNCKFSGLSSDYLYLDNGEYNLEFNAGNILKAGKYINNRVYISSVYYNDNKSSLVADGYTLDEATNSAKKETDVSNVDLLTNLNDIKSSLESNGYSCVVSENN